MRNKRWQKYYISKNELEKWKHLNSSRKIGKKLGVSQSSVLKYLKKYNLFDK
jgi:Mn-dependent DtxR family transcriptional regulator